MKIRDESDLIDHIIKKSGTPTMGGVIIIIGIVSSTLLWADLKNVYAVAKIISKNIFFFKICFFKN